MKKRRVGISTQMLIAFCGLALGMLIPSGSVLYFFSELRKTTDYLYNDLSMQHEKVMHLNHQFKEGKNLMVRYLLETDPQKLGYWRDKINTVFPLLYQEVSSFEHMEEAQKKFLDFEKNKDILFEKHQEQIASYIYRNNLKKEINRLQNAMIYQLGQISWQRTNGLAQQDIQSLMKNIHEAGWHLLNFEVSPLRETPSSEILSLLESHIDSFKKEIKKFDTSSHHLLAKLNLSNRKFLAKAKKLSIEYRNLILSEGKIVDLIKQETQNMFITWGEVDKLNETYEKINKLLLTLEEDIKKNIKTTGQNVLLYQGQVQFYFFVFIVLMIFLGVLTYLFVKRRFAQPLIQVAELSRRVQEGGLNQHLSLPRMLWTDEMTEVISSLNSMIDKLKRSREQLHLATQEIVSLYKNKDGETFQKKSQKSFLESFSYDFRGPLAIVKQGLENLDIMDLSQEEKKLVLEGILKATDQMYNLITVYVDTTVKKEAA